MFDTLAVFQLAMFWLKAVAVQNMHRMFDTLAVFQLARFWSNAEAAVNSCEQAAQRHR